MKKIMSKLLLLLAVFIVGLSFFLPGRIIRIADITCESQFGACSQEIENAVKEHKGKNLSFAKSELIKTLDNEVSVGDYIIKYEFPNKMGISIIEKKPKYTLSTTDVNSFVNVDREGVVVSITDSSELPTIITDEPLPAKGDLIDQRLKFSLELLDSVYSAFQVKEGFLQRNSLVIELPDNLRVIFPVEGDRDVLVGSLVLLYSEYQDSMDREKGSMEDIDLIDLRFKNPVLKSGDPIVDDDATI